MISGISLGKSFFHCISYCLEDKRELTEEQKINLSLKDGLRHKDRAEILAYNKCFGSKYELAEQFNDVRKLSKRVEKPVLHLSMRLAPGESLNKNQLLDIADEMVKEMGVADNQYIVIQHRDTKEQHIHIVANRVGYEGKAASSSNNYYKMDKLCRRLEKQYNLQQVLSPKSFLSAEQRLIPRHDIRKERLKNDIRQTLQKVKNYPEFEQQIKSLGYKIIKGRGISFIDDKKVKIKGSEVGFSLATLEKVFALKNGLATQLSQKKNIPEQNPSGAGYNKGEKKQPQLLQHPPAPYTVTQKIVQPLIPVAIHEKSVLAAKELSGILGELLHPDQMQPGAPEGLLNKKKKRKKKKLKIGF